MSTSATTAAGGQPSSSSPRSTADLYAPCIANYEDVWTSRGLSEQSLKTVKSLFTNSRQWYVCQSYLELYDDIIVDKKRRRRSQIVNGTAGVGKSSFLLHALARCRCKGKSVLLHYHINEQASGITVFFPTNGEPHILDKGESFQSSTSKLEVKNPFS